VLQEGSAEHLGCSFEVVVGGSSAVLVLRLLVLLDLDHSPGSRLPLLG